MRIVRHQVATNDGWRLDVKQTLDPARHNPRFRPVTIVPGYGMNAFIFGYHPTGLSMEAYLAHAGFEVWSLNLRGQGASRLADRRTTPRFGLRELALVDLPAAVDFIAARNAGGHERVDLIGCSLGGTIVYAYAGIFGAARIGAIVGMGAPLRWEAIHPVLKFAFGSPAVAGLLRIKHTRAIARCGLPLLKRVPRLLSIYLHPEIVDLSQAETLAETVEDPRPELNREIAAWIRDQDLILDGENVTERFRSVARPLFIMLANADGIVPPATVLSAESAAASAVKDVYTAGDERVKLAHADMFVSEYAQQMVFEPLAAWLARQNG